MTYRLCGLCILLEATMLRIVFMSAVDLTISIQVSYNMVISNVLYIIHNAVVSDATLL